jgi:ketosteroid isomerase-like protein
MNTEEKEIWAFLHRHLQSIFSRDAAAYQATTATDLSLYEWFITPHRQDGLDFHLFMIEHSWAGAGADFRYDLWEPRLQRYGDTAIVTYTFMLSIVTEAGIQHHTNNETRVLIKGEAGWQVVHVHKSPAGKHE